LEILRRNVSSPIHTGKTCNHVSDPTEPTVWFDDGTRIRPEILVGADGIHSTVREAVTSVSERSLDTTVLRAVTSVPPEQRDESTGFEVWGDGTYTGGAPIGRDRFYWFATVPEELSEPVSVDAIRSFYASYPAPIPAITETVTAEDVIATTLVDLPSVDRWFRGSTVLAGDAAHGMLPFAGQGAAQSIEDALALASALDSHTNVTDAFAEYESQRLSRANKIRTESHFLGRLGTVQSPIACWLRNTAVRALPDAVVNRFRHRRVANASIPPTVSSGPTPSNARHRDEQVT
jgi:2-polyprenyl-6-methoxyphenol hydroxylase-like FAD-dependent oxidoreductase